MASAPLLGSGSEVMYVIGRHRAGLDGDVNIGQNSKGERGILF